MGRSRFEGNSQELNGYYFHFSYWHKIVRFIGHVYLRKRHAQINFKVKIKKQKSNIEYKNHFDVNFKVNNALFLKL